MITGAAQKRIFFHWLSVFSLYSRSGFSLIPLLHPRQAQRFSRAFHQAPHAAASLLSALFLLAATLVPIIEAEAATYHIRAQSAARATQHLRSDTTFSAPRIWSQSLTLSAYDLRGTEDNTLNARISLRYITDFALVQRLRSDPLFDARFNDLSLDIAYLQWKPLESLELIAGRQWYYSALGINDFDGLAISFRIPRGDWRPFLALAGGRNVQRGLTPWDPGAWDVQGLPPNEIALSDDPFHLVGAARTGVAFRDLQRIELAVEQFQRRQPDSASWIITRRLGAAATASPREDFTLTTAASLHSAVQGLDRFHVDAAFRRGQAILSSGIDHRHPVFDSTSIFNLFGANPYRSAYASYGHRFSPFSTRLEIRGWLRAYFDAPAIAFDLGDARAFGAALSGAHRFPLFVPLEVAWQVSAQSFSDHSGGDQYLGDLRLRAPSPVDGLFLTGRILSLYASPSHHRYNAGYASSALLGAELAIAEIGLLSLSMEGRGGSFTPSNTALFAFFELEAWR